MKKVICTLTAVAFALGLAGTGFSQTATKEAEKPAVKMEAPTAPAQVTPGQEKAAKPEVKPVTQEKKDTAKKDDKSKVKKDVKKGDKQELKSTTKVEETKKEEKK
jgi:hypothetical protein